MIKSKALSGLVDNAQFRPMLRTQPCNLCKLALINPKYPLLPLIRSPLNPLFPDVCGWVLLVHAEELPVYRLPLMLGHDLHECVAD